MGQRRIAITPSLLWGRTAAPPKESSNRSAMDGILEARSEEDQLKPTETQTPVPADAGLEAVNKCLAAAAYSLKFDIAELWRFGPDHSKRRGRGSMAGGAAGAGAATATAKGASKPFCEHVYTMPATLKTYTGRIMGIWNSGYHDSRAPQDHLLSPLVRFLDWREFFEGYLCTSCKG